MTDVWWLLVWSQSAWSSKAHTLSFKHIFKSQWTLMGFGCCPVTLQPQPQPPGHFWSNYPAAMCIHHYTASRLVRHLNKPSLQKSFQRLQLSGTRSKHQSQPLESKAMRPSGISGLLRLLSSHFSLYPQIYQKTWTTDWRLWATGRCLAAGQHLASSQPPYTCFRAQCPPREFGDHFIWPTTLTNRSWTEGISNFRSDCCLSVPVSITDLPICSRHGPVPQCTTPSMRRPRSGRAQSTDIPTPVRTRLISTGTRQSGNVQEFKQKLELFLTVTEGQQKRYSVKNELFQQLLGIGLYFGEWMVKILLVFCWISCKEWLCYSVVVFLVRAPTFLQATVLENVDKPIYHSQPEATEASHNMPEEADCRLPQSSCTVLPFCSEYPHQHSTENNPPLAGGFVRFAAAQVSPWSGDRFFRVSQKKWQQLEPAKLATPPAVLLARRSRERAKTKACPKSRMTARMPKEAHTEKWKRSLWRVLFRPPHLSGALRPDPLGWDSPLF